MSRIVRPNMKVAGTLALRDLAVARGPVGGINDVKDPRKDLDVAPSDEGGAPRPQYT